MKSPIVKLVFLGASTAFYEVIEIIRRINLIAYKYEVITILDDNKDTHGKEMNGIRVEGPLSLAHNYPDARFVFGIGSMNTRLIRRKILDRIGIADERFETIIHPNATIDPSATIGYGCIIHPGVVIGNDAILESFVIVAVNSAIGPYARLEQFAMVTSLVVILTGAVIGKSVFIGSCSCVTENVVVERGSMIGAGTVVSRNIAEGSFFLGNPGRLISKIEIESDI